jgi:hypothetical protein
MKLCRVAAVLVTTTTLCSCAKQETIPTTTVAKEEASREEAASIAEEAYIYAFPMLESYKEMYARAIDRTDPGYIGPFNELFQSAGAETQGDASVSRLRSDTLQSVAWLDLRAQPIVLNVPATEGRYYSVQLVDMFTRNFAYIGTRVTGNDAGSYLIAGPGWQGTKPATVKAVFKSRSGFVYCVIRIERRGSKDQAAAAFQKRFSVVKMSTFVGGGEGPDAAGITFPSYDAKRAETVAFIDLFNFLLAEVAVPEEEQELMSRFAAIGVEPGAPAASLSLISRTRWAIDEGIAKAFAKMVPAVQNPSGLDAVTVRTKDGWRGVDGLFREGSAPETDYLLRAVAAKIGLYGNASREVYHAVTSEDSAGKSLDAAVHDYVLHFAKNELPKVEGFWSLTMHSPPSPRGFASDADVYSVLNRRMLRYEEDGSLTIYIQRQSPGPKHESNWLPAPPGPFSLRVSSYFPKPAAMSPLYLPPAVQRAN